MSKTNIVKPKISLIVPLNYISFFTALDAREIFGFEYTLVFLIVRRAEDIADRAVRVLIDGDEAVLCLAVYIVVAEGREQKSH